MASGLRVVAPNEAPEPPRTPKTVTEAAESEDRLELLVAMRRRIAQTVANPDCPPRDLASLTKRLADIAKEIESLKAQRKQDADESEVYEDAAFDASAV